MDVKRLRAIKTRYKGYAFRSRLEARWAIFFDHLGIKWEYEPEGFELGNGMRYLPDFWLPDFNLWVEVKPSPPDDVGREKAYRLTYKSEKPLFFAHGMPDVGGTLFYAKEAMAGEVSLRDVPACMAWADKHVFVFHPYAHDEIGDLLVVKMEKLGSLSEMQHLYPEFTLALEAARSARFEFGERGAA